MHAEHCITKDCQYILISEHDSIFNLLKDRYEYKCGMVGRHRTTLISKNVVIKIPRNHGGVKANTSEFELSRDYYKGLVRGRFKWVDIRPARCRIRMFYNTPVLIMEKLKTDNEYSQYPSGSWNFDCSQVGTDKLGRWKAYDFSED